MEGHTHGGQRCSATSSQTGQPCKKYAIKGGTVCASHGGNAPQVRAAARKRLQELVHPAISRLQDLLRSDDERVALQAVRLVKDWATDPETGDPMGLPMPTTEQIDAWISELEQQANG